jgi:ABC-2 type transport system ATP-binding protein
MNILEIKNLEKKYDSGTHALKNINLTIRQGELFALLGPNGAGKTTLIGVVCGTVSKTGGTIRVGKYNADKDWRAVRHLIGYVPQELTLNPFDTVWDTIVYQRGFYGRTRNDALLEKILSDLSLWEKRTSMIRELSGGMKRRVLIAKALTNEPEILFLDEPSAGVDVELRKEMWDFIKNLKSQGVTIVLTTHYLEEAELLADRIGIIREGKLSLVAEKQNLLDQFGEKTLTLILEKPLETIPASLKDFNIILSENKDTLIYHYSKGQNNVTELLKTLHSERIFYRDMETAVSSLEDIFLQLIEKKEGGQ